MSTSDFGQQSSQNQTKPKLNHHRSQRLVPTTFEHEHPAIPSNQMIVNSQPYNPSHQSQQQRCIGLMQQQNSLYGSAFSQANQQAAQQHAGAANQMTMQQQQQQSHLLDLAKLQQNIFDSGYDDATLTQTSARVAREASERAAGSRAAEQLSQANDMSLYSPSSSTSLLYHIYDQINLPSEQQHQQYQHSAANEPAGALFPQAAKKASSTILNPANLFGQQQLAGAGLPSPLPHQRQGQAAELQKSLASQQQHLCYSAAPFNQLLQQQPFATLHGQPAYLGTHNSLMAEAVLRQHQAATARHQRPLSSSAASSMSGNSVPIAYGRQARAPSSAKSQANLASVLQSNSALGHLGIGASPSQPSTAGSCPSGLLSGTKWKRANQRARHLVYEYRTIFNCSILLILLALSLLSIIKFTLLSASTQAPAATNTQLSSSQLASQSQLGPVNTLLYPPQFPHKPDGPSLGPTVGQPNEADTDEQRQASEQERIAPSQQQQQQQQQQDVLKSKLLIGEFVILSQNYSHSPAQRSLLAERIVKLMDQVFLATDVRRVYSRMEVTNIRPNRPSGVVVDCNIILSDSIAYAAQQFGIALYDSLAKNHERLANQPNYLIDKNSIRFNTVPDKDLKSGIVPPGLISPSVSRELASNPDQVAPSAGQPLERTIEPIQVGSTQVDSLDQLNSVVWSEWSQWSSCVDKNGICDPTRLHSRLRKCVAQHTGEKVEAAQCKQRFNIQDQELEVADCSKSCNQQQQQQAPDSHIMSDAPSVVGPQTAPSVLVGLEPVPFVSVGVPTPMLLKSKLPAGQSRESANQASNPHDLYAPTSSSAAAAAAAALASVAPSGGSAAGQHAASTTERSQSSASSAGELLGSSLATPTLVPPTELGAGGSQMSCSNCTSDEICLLLMQQKVPFCGKIKDRTDESGCGGWCKAQNQLCQPVGQNAFKCIHDSECVAEEWRCHDSACIPLSKRCDGHSNCYDSSDERDCPI